MSLLCETDAAVRSSTRASLVARITGAVFIPAGLIKFAAYGWEVDNFRRFGLPAPEAWVITAGLVETIGGLALLRGRGVVPASVVLAATMVVAISTSGIKEGDVLPSLTVAPALLAAMLYLLSRARRAR